MPDWSAAVEAEISFMVLKLMSENDRAHGFEHVQQVVGNAKMLMNGTRCAIEILLPAAYFHDVVPRFSTHGYSSAVSASASLAREHLARLSFSDSQIQKIDSCIRTASWEHAARGGEPDGIEAYILRDADLLEATGAHGVARVFSFAGEAALPIRWIEMNLDNPQRLLPNLEMADPNPFYHFFSKLLWLNDLFYTHDAKREGERRRRFLLNFLVEYDRENRWSNRT